MVRLICSSILFSLIFVVHCSEQRAQSRIFDGTNAGIDEFPWMALIRFTESQNLENSTAVCAASIISSDYLLTAASCFFGYHLLPFNFFVQAGVYNLSGNNGPSQQNHRIRTVTVHPQYEFARLINDLAIVRLFTPLTLDSRFVSTIELSEEAYLGEKDLFISGWGLINQGNQSVAATLLQKRIVQENLDCSCQKTVDPVTQFCTTGACLRDSGGPVMLYMNQTNTYRLAGIIGFRSRCQEDGFSTRIYPFISWIRSITEITTTAAPTTTVSIYPPTQFNCNTSSTCGCSSVPVVFNDILDSRLRSALHHTRIVGGQEARPFSWPWIANIRMILGFSCGGSIIDEQWILTAAHCVLVENYTTVTIGAHDLNGNQGQRRNIAEVIRHPLFVPPPAHINDIALVRVSPPFNLNPFDVQVKRTCLPTQNETSDYPSPGTRLAVIGWGRLGENVTTSPRLQQVRVVALDNDDVRCSNATFDRERQFCAFVEGGGRDACQGDSGGPIHHFIDGVWRQIGIVSFGDGCGRPNNPGVYTRLAFYYDWIQSVINRRTRTV